MPDIREEMTIQVIVNGKRNWVEISHYGHRSNNLYTMRLLGQDCQGECAFAEGLSLEECIMNFTKSWEQWNECGPY